MHARPGLSSRKSWISTIVLASGKWISAKSEHVDIVDGGMAIYDLDVAPAFERRE